MGNKVGFFVNKSLDEIVAYLLSKPIPVVLGPEGKYYQIDGHHTAYAFAWWKRNVLGPMEPSPLRDKLKDLPLVAEVLCNWTSRFPTTDLFWNAMSVKNWALLESMGRARSYEELPNNIAEMGDNPYRSLAGIAELVPVPAIGKTCIPFAEFRWADYYLNLARQGKMGLFMSMALATSQQTNFSAFVEYTRSDEFLNLTHAVAAAQSRR